MGRRGWNKKKHGFFPSPPFISSSSLFPSLGCRCSVPYSCIWDSVWDHERKQEKGGRRKRKENKSGRGHTQREGATTHQRLEEEEEEERTTFFLQILLKDASVSEEREREEREGR